MSWIDLIWKLIRYNLKIVFGNKFVFFLLGALGFFLFVTIVSIFEDAAPSEQAVYQLLLFPGLLLVFYPSVFGIQNDEDARILEILFGIPNYRYKVWLVRLLMILIITFLVLLIFGWLATLAIYPVDFLPMVGHLIFPVFFMGTLGFMLSTIIRNGNGTAVVMIILGVIFMISAGILDFSSWNIFLNPYRNPPSDMNEVVWERTIFYNRIYLLVGIALTLAVALVNMQKREKFV